MHRRRTPSLAPTEQQKRARAIQIIRMDTPLRRLLFAPSPGPSPRDRDCPPLVPVLSGLRSRPLSPLKRGTVSPHKSQRTRPISGLRAAKRGHADKTAQPGEGPARGRNVWRSARHSLAPENASKQKMPTDLDLALFDSNVPSLVRAKTPNLGHRRTESR